MQLRQSFASAVDEALGSCSEQAFCDGFNLPAEHAQVLARAHQQATDKLRGNALVSRPPLTDGYSWSHLAWRAERSKRRARGRRRPRIAGGAQPHQR